MSAAALTTPMIYVDCDLPGGQTLHDWRRARDAAPATITPMSSVLRRVRRTCRARWPRRAGAPVLAPAL